MQNLQNDLAHVFVVPPLHRCIMACHGGRDLRLTDTFSGDVTELLQSGGKRTDCIANFPTTINLQYEIVGAELSRPKAAHYCFILLVSYYQQSQSTPTAPLTQSRFYITSIRRCTNAENI